MRCACSEYRRSPTRDTRVRYGYRRVHVMPRREGRKDNVRRVYRLYCEERLSLVSVVSRPSCQLDLLQV